jgi:hypothetical protein
MTSTTGGSSGMAMKAKVAIIEDNYIILLDLSLLLVLKCIGHSWMAIAEDNLIQLLDPPMPDNVDHILSSDILHISKLNSISPIDHLYAYIAKACMEDVNLLKKMAY